MGIVEKVLVWRLISIVLTLGITYAWTGNLLSASGMTIVLQVVLLLAHALFEYWWELLKVRKKMGLEKIPPRKTASGRKDDEDITDHNMWRPGK